MDSGSSRGLGNQTGIDSSSSHSLADCLDLGRYYYREEHR